MVAISALVLSASVWVSAPGPPEPGASAARIRAFVEANLHDTTLAVVAATIGFGALILVTVGLWRLVAARVHGQDIAAVTLLVSGSLSALWLGVTAAVDLIPVVAANDAGKLSAYSDQTLLTLDLVDRLGETFGDVSTVPRGLFLVSAGLLIVRHRMLPRWTGYLALVIGAASLIGIVVVGLFGFVLWILIVGVASVVMLLAQWQRSRRGGHPRNRPRRPAPARGGEDAPRGTLGSLHVRTPDEVKRRHPRPTAREPELRQNGPVQTDPARGGPRSPPPP